MTWKRMDRKTARDFYQRLKTDKTFLQELTESLIHPDLEEPYVSIRDSLKRRFSEAVEITKRNEQVTRSREYSIDLDMAEEIYLVMSKYGLSARDAADEEIWIYISVNVIPDIIIDRFRLSGISLPHEDRFYANARRIYPMMLWWYYHIAYQDDDPNPIISTRDILINNQSDDISQLIERAGSGGYPIRIYKQIMAEYSKRLKKNQKPDGLLSRALKLNIVQMQSMEPELMYDGLEVYVSDIFDRVEK